MADWYETREILRRLTFRRAANATALWASYHAARALRRPIVWGYPATLGVEPTTACNLRCPHCISGLRAFERPTGKLSIDLYKGIIDELASDLMYVMLYFQGEPYIHPQFLELVSYAAKRDLFVTTSTNGHFLDEDRARATVESGLGKLIISLDGATAESYAQYRVGGDFDEVLEGARRVIAWKKKLRRKLPIVDVQFLVFGHNEHEIQAVQKLGKTLGADRVRLKTAQLYDFEDAERWLPTDEKYSRYEKEDKKEETIDAGQPTPKNGFKMRGKVPDHCWKLWIGAQMTWDGRLVPCCFDKNAKYELGRAGEKPVREFWKKGEAYRNFRQNLLNGRAQTDICANCTEGIQIWA